MDVADVLPLKTYINRVITFGKVVLLSGSSLLAFAPPAMAHNDLVLLDAVYVADIWHNFRGGLRTGTKYLDNLDLMLTVDSRAFGVEDGTFFAYGLYNNNTTLSDTLVGDAQTISNIDATQHFRLEEFWYEQRFADGAASIKAGLIDLNSEFDAKDTASLFIDSSHGIGPDFSQTGKNGPSIFPSTSLAVRLDWKIRRNLLVRVAAFDAVPNDPAHPKRLKLSWDEGTLFVAEAEYTLISGTRIGVGGWQYTSRFDPILAVNGRKVRGNNGLYLYAEGPLYRESQGLNKGLDGFIRIGVADSTINQFASYWSAGVVYTGPFRDRAADRIGLAIAYAVNGSDFKQSILTGGGLADNAEINIEMTYRAQLTDWFAVQPDIQYVINPGAAGGLENALVAGLRFEIGASF